MAKSSNTSSPFVGNSGVCTSPPLLPLSEGLEGFEGVDGVEGFDGVEGVEGFVGVVVVDCPFDEELSVVLHPAKVSKATTGKTAKTCLIFIISFPF